MAKQIGRNRYKREQQFSRIPSVNVPRSILDRSHQYKTTIDAGPLYPVWWDEALPGDTISLSMASFARMTTLLNPIMDNLYMEFFFFAVPYRLIYTDWERLNGEEDTPGGGLGQFNFLLPVMESPDPDGYAELSLPDYFAIPTKVPRLEHSAMPFRAYNLVYSEWFRPQDIIEKPVLNTGAGPDDIADYPLVKRAKRHDYFTACQPFPVKGPEVPLPLGDTAPVFGALKAQDMAFPGSAPTGVPTFKTAAGTAPQNAKLRASEVAGGLSLDGLSPGGGPNVDDAAWVDPQLQIDDQVSVADLKQATAATINELREAFAIQRLYERDSRGGTRYTELLRSHFGVISPDMRLQRPEYLGGTRTMLNINPVAATAQVQAGTGNAALGELGAFATGSTNGMLFRKSFTEHCICIGLVNIRAELTYQQGLEKFWSRRTRVDHYWPSLRGLGEQAVLNKEIFAQGKGVSGADGPVDDQVFGYIPRWDEYRHKRSNITGRFRSNASQPLDPWHLAQQFPSLPLLNRQFLEEDPPIDRVIAIPSEPQFRLDTFFVQHHARPMPTQGVPGGIDRF